PVVKITTFPRCTELRYRMLIKVLHRKDAQKNLPYSGGAHGPSPFATLPATSSYHSSFVLPCKRPTTTMVILSHPTPPVSLLEARQLFIMFSQILCRSCFAAIPRRTNSITA